MGIFQQFQTCLFLLWDDNVFFGFAHYKLPRLKGIKPRWYDRFKNPIWLLKMIMLAAVFAYILSVQFPHLYTIKTQSIT